MNLFIEHARTLLTEGQTWSREAELLSKWQGSGWRGRAVISALGMARARRLLRSLLHTLLMAVYTMLTW